MGRTSSWEQPEEPPVRDSERIKTAIAAAALTFKGGFGWRVAIRAAVAAVDAYDDEHRPVLTNRAPELHEQPEAP
jgi:hypothetical protein